MMENKSETIARPASTPSGAIAHSQDTKALANLMAGFSISGFAVHKLPSGGYSVSRWNLSKHCPDLVALEAFARQVGVRL